MSSAIASSILRMFSACCCSWLWVLNLDSFVTPSTSWATSAPNRSSTSVRLYSVSSGTSWRSAACDRDRVDAELGEDLGRRDRVGDVRLAGRAALALVGLDREVERLADRFEVGARECSAMDRGVEAGARGPRGRRPACVACAAFGFAGRDVAVAGRRWCRRSPALVRRAWLPRRTSCAVRLASCGTSRLPSAQG